MVGRLIWVKERLGSIPSSPRDLCFLVYYEQEQRNDIV